MSKDKYIGSVKFFKHIILTFSVFAVIGITVAVVLFLMRSDSPEENLLTGEIIHGRGIVASPDNIDDIRAQAEEPIRGASYRTRMTTRWTFETWDSPSNAFVENAKSNSYTVFFDLKLRETGEIVYSSPFIPVGAKWESFALDTEVPAGEHAAIVTYHLVDEDYEQLSTVSVSVTLRILG